MYKWYLRIFCVFGFYPNIEKYYSGLYTLVNFMIVTTLIIYVGLNHETILYSKTPIGNINDIILLGSLYFAHLISILETYVKRRYLIKFWKNFDKVEKLIVPKTNWKKKFIVKSVLLCMFTIAIETAVITNISSDVQWTVFWYYEIFSLLMTRLRHFQQIFFVEIIYNYLQEFNRILSSLMLWTQSLEKQEVLAKKHFQRKIMELKHSYHNLMAMIICVNKVFCWSQVFNFVQHFIEITIELYWIYVFSMKSEEFLWRELFYVLVIFNFEHFLFV